MEISFEGMTYLEALDSLAVMQRNGVKLDKDLKNVNFPMPTLSELKFVRGRYEEELKKIPWWRFILKHWVREVIKSVTVLQQLLEVRDEPKADV